VYVGAQVAPAEKQFERNSVVWPFCVLLGGLLTPGLVTCVVEIWTNFTQTGHSTFNIFLASLMLMGLPQY
jgi:hypothetical protein